ncbi:MAG: tRNA pseudouridine(55) synthase TruB [Nitriliruptor sp.]|uniref:tRNA pseudouridine(55) synthase TruB n=1 Tax=Nitriliruptor sp. TaxID=2448056 RepID=UPI0034A04EBB
MARRRREGEPDRAGVLLVDKDLGPTSHDVVQDVRRAAGQRRVGHTGTLDPAATGVLVACLGRATKLVPFLQQAGTKTYAARMVLGVETTSQDAQGEVVARTPAGHVDERTFCEVLTRFVGDLDQVPPMVSAVRVGGERLHEIARRGEVVEREPRRVTVHDLILDGYGGSDPDHPEASFLVTCSAGTYVRTLAHDVGAALGVGGSLTALRRVANGPFTVDESHTIAAVREAAEQGQLDALLLDPLTAVSRALPTVEVTDDDLVRRLAHGGKLPTSLLEPALGSGYQGPVAVRSGQLLVGVYAPSGAESRAELVWTRPEELGPAPDSRPEDV